MKPATTRREILKRGVTLAAAAGMAPAFALSPRAALSFQEGVENAARQMALLQRDYDILLSPPLATPPVELGKLNLNQDNAAYEKEAINISAFTMLYNATGQPAMSVPLHWTPEGLPVGVMFAGRYGEEGLLFQLAGQLEQASPWFHKVAPL